MDTFESIMTKLDVREFSPKDVPPDVKWKVLEAARQTGSGKNSQHWRFILVEGEELEKLASDSTSGGWVRGASFAVIVLTDPKRGFHLIDTGRVVQDMELAAWNYGVVSCLYTGIKEDELARDFAVPSELAPTAVVGFGYPVRKLRGRKSRRPIEELAYAGRYGQPLKISGKVQQIPSAKSASA